MPAIPTSAVLINTLINRDLNTTADPLQVVCAWPVSAAPVTVKLSSTYFNDRGRNIIFAWTGLLLAGLLSLTVEFYRINTRPCGQDDHGRPLTNDHPEAFPYGSFTCGLTCDIGPGNPWSPMRSWYGSTNNIYVIPAPHTLTFGTGTLLAAACCLPAILSLVTMWDRIAEFNWRQRFFPKTDPEVDETIEGTNGATPSQMKTVQEDIKKYLKIAIEIPIFGAAVLAILVLGEKNFWSTPVNYQTEPMASIGQWGPIVGTGLAALGSLVLVVRAADGEDGSDYSEGKSAHYHRDEGIFLPANSRLSPARARSTHEGSSDSLPRVSLHENGTGLRSTISQRSNATDAGNRRKFAAALSKMGDYIGTPSRKRFDYSDFRQGPATDYPEIPGESNRNRALSKIRRDWPTPSIRDEHSRSGSPESRLDIEVGAPSQERESSQSPQLPSTQWPTSPPRAARASTMPTNRTPTPTPLLNEPSSSSGDIPGRSSLRRDTLEVPSLTHLTHMRNCLSESSVPTVALPASDHSPAIVVSQEPDPARSPDLLDSHTASLFPDNPPTRSKEGASPPN
ncbi:transferase family III-like protein [Seiridium cupressi]